MKVALSLVLLVAVLGSVLSVAVQPAPDAADVPVPADAVPVADAVPAGAGAPGSSVGLPGGFCKKNWHGRWSQYLIDLWNCHAFYECSNGVPVHFNCPSGLCWNFHLETCDYQSNNGCAWPCRDH